MSRILHITLVLSLLFLSRAAIDLKTWEFFADNATLLSFSGQRMVKRLQVGNPKFPSAQGEFFDHTTQGWTSAGMRVNRIKITPTEEWILEYGLSLLVRPVGTTSWTRLGGPMDDFAPADNNFFWAVYRSLNRVVKRSRTSNTETAHNIDAKFIAVDPISKNPWIVKANGDIFKYNGASWVKVTGKANDITFGTTSEPYIVSQDATPEGFVIKKWNSAGSGSWQTIPGIGGVSVAVGGSGDKEIYVITNDGSIYRQRGVPSNFCTMCKPNCPECASYEGYCRTSSPKCLNCISGFAAAESPLRCVACPAECETCSTPTKCTSCKPEYTLSSNGTCGGPCVEELSNVFYYPSDNSCRDKCDVKIVDPTVSYNKCDPCPDNCLFCSSTTVCLKCSSTHFLSHIGTCLPTCPPPLVSFQDTDQNWRCHGPCGAQMSDGYYDLSDGLCKPACRAPILACPETLS